MFHICFISFYQSGDLRVEPGPVPERRPPGTCRRQISGRRLLMSETGMNYRQQIIHSGSGRAVPEQVERVAVTAKSHEGDGGIVVPEREQRLKRRRIVSQTSMYQKLGKCAFHVRGLHFHDNTEVDCSVHDRDSIGISGICQRTLAKRRGQGVYREKEIYAHVL